jgi:RNA polymerase sigma-70 factor, ECF subfamily
MRKELPTQFATKESTDFVGTFTPVRPDEELLTAYTQTGNRDAFEELVHRYERELYRYLRRRLGDAHLAEDAFQTTFLQVHLKCQQFEAGRRFRPWLYAIAGHQAVDLLRRNRRHKAVSLDAAREDGSDDKRQPLGSLLENEGADPGQRLRRIEDRQWTRLALRKIPTKARQVLVLVVHKGLAYREAAKVLGIPVGTVKSRMHSALPILHRALIATRHSVVNNKRHTANL